MNVLASIPSLIDDEERSVMEQKVESEAVIDPVLIDVFQEEAEEILQHLKANYIAWKAEEDSYSDESKQAIENLRRSCHTLKGSARMVGANALGDLGATGEVFFDKVISDSLSFNEANPVMGRLIGHINTYFDELISRVNGASKTHLLIQKINEFTQGDVASFGAPSLAKKPHNTPSKPSQNVSPVTQKEVTATDDFPSSDKTTSTEAPIERPIEVVNSQSPREVTPVLEHNQLDTAVEATQSIEATDRNEPSEAVDDEEPDFEFIAIYLEELSELLEQLDDVIQRLKATPDDKSLIHEAERVLHTVKGGARMTGLKGIADLSHITESILNRISSTYHVMDEYTQEKLQEVSDELASMAEAVAVNGKDYFPGNTIDDLNNLLAQMGGETFEVTSDKASQSEEKHVEPQPIIDSAEAVNSDPNHTVENEISFKSLGNSILSRLLSARLQGSINLDSLSKKDDKEPLSALVSNEKESSVRVSSVLVNSLIDKMAEWSIQGSKLTEDLEGAEKNIDEMKRTTIRLQEQIRRLSIDSDSRIKHSHSQLNDTCKAENFDALEMDEYSEMQQLSRALSETVNDMSSITEGIEQLFKDLTKSGRDLENGGREIQQGLISTRMTRLSGILPRLKRIVRQTSTELNKKVTFEIKNSDNEIDRTILQRVIASLEHLLRNSLAHGIESPEERKQLGKPETGSIILDFDREGAEIVITLLDDGRGLDTKQIRQKAIDKGLISANESLTKAEIHRLILSSGLTTSGHVTQISGRGVGMDVVNAELHDLGGGIEINSEEGKYTEFILRLPYTLATNQVLMLSVGGELLALPVGQIVGFHRLHNDKIEAYLNQSQPPFEYQGKPCQLVDANHLLGIPKVNDSDTDVRPIIILEKNDEKIALIVDDIQTNKEVMLKPLGSLFSESRLISAATILGGGRIVLILDGLELIDMVKNNQAFGDQHELVEESSTAVSILVVDDSITVRKVSAKILEASGFEVLTATDGVNALEVLETNQPDIILLDIEMPHMDGFELLSRLKSSQQWLSIPVIMISSRTGAKHRQQAASLGANQFIGKPWHQEKLLSEISLLLKQK